MIHRFWKYQNQTFPDWKAYFERPFHPDGKPPVFQKKVEDINDLCPDCCEELGIMILMGLEE